MPLHSSVHQGLFGESFVYTIASAAGLTMATMNLDVDGVDLLLARPGVVGSVRSPKIEVQVKSWSTPHGDDADWYYRIRVDHFNKIAGGGFQIPRYLFLVVVPAQVDDWVSVSPDAIEVRHAIYWASLSNRSPIADPSPGATVRVEVPKRNLVTPESLTALIDLGSSIFPGPDSVLELDRGVTT